MATASSESMADRGPTLIAVSIVFIIITTVFVGLRLWARRISKVNIWYDDYVVVLAMVQQPRTSPSQREV